MTYAGREFGSLSELAVRDDALRPYRGERPPRIAGYTPDVFVVDVPTTMTLIGEAKTHKDVENDHTRRQLLAFLDYLSNTPNGFFVLSVPFGAGAAARRLVDEASGSFSGAGTRAVVLECPYSAV